MNMTTLRIPIEPQPHKSKSSYRREGPLVMGGELWYWPAPKGHKVKHAEGENWMVGSPAMMECAPHQPGDRLPVRERWSTIPTHDGSMVAIYPDDSEEHIDEIIQEGWDFLGEWNEAETMPLKYVRKWQVVESVSVECSAGVWNWVVQVEETSNS